MQLNYVLRSHWLHHGGSIEDGLRSADAIVAVNIADRAAKAAIANSAVPVIYSGWSGPQAQVDVVGSTDHESGETIVLHLHDLGHVEIAYVHGTGDLRGRSVRLSGARLAAESTGVTVHDLFWTEESTFSQEFARLLDSGARPTALFCAHDTLALAAVTDVLSRGWRVPEDISVIGFGDFTPARQVRPPLTTMRVKGQEIGRTMARLLHLRLTGTEWPTVPMQIRIVNELMLRSSCGSAPGSHPLERANKET